MADSKHQVVFCNDSPKRVLVSVIKTTPIKPRAAESLMPTSPGFSDFMVYPWRWGENAHNVSLSPGSCSGTASPGRNSGSPAESDANSCPEHLKVRVKLNHCTVLVKHTVLYNIRALIIFLSARSIAKRRGFEVQLSAYMLVTLTRTYVKGALWTGFKFSSIVRQLEVGRDVRRARQNVSDYASRKLHLPQNDR